MTLLSSPVVNQNSRNGDVDLDEVRALARLLAFAHQAASDLKLDATVACIEMALGSVLRDTNGEVAGLSAQANAAGRKMKAH